MIRMCDKLDREDPMVCFPRRRLSQEQTSSLTAQAAIPWGEGGQVLSQLSLLYARTGAIPSPPSPTHLMTVFFRHGSVTQWTVPKIFLHYWSK